LGKKGRGRKKQKENQDFKIVKNGRHKTYFGCNLALTGSKKGQHRALLRKKRKTKQHRFVRGVTGKGEGTENGREREEPKKRSLRGGKRIGAAIVWH